MDIMLLRVFQAQVLRQCEFMLVANAELTDALEASNGPAVFYALQNLLNAAANVAKALWGSKGKRLVERKALRDSIGVSDDSPLCNVTMRNNFDHFDERLDKWWVESERHNYVDCSVGSAQMVIVGTERTDLFRAYDPTTGVLYFWGEEFNLKQVVSEVEKFLPQLKVEANKPHWDRRLPNQPQEPKA